MREKSIGLMAIMVALALLAGPVGVYPGHKPNHNPGGGGGGGGGSEVDPAILTIEDGFAVSSDESKYVDQQLWGGPSLASPILTDFGF